MCLKIKLKSALKNALSFSLDPRRISVMFSVIAITGFAILFSILYFAAYLPTNVMPFSKMAETVPNYAGNLIWISILLAVIVALSTVLSILMKGAFIHNYTIRDSKDGIIRSIDALGGRMKHLITITLLIILVSMVFDYIPIFGGIANIIFSFAVFFAYQELIIAKKGAIDSIKGSFSILKENWKDVIVSIIAVVISASAIIIVFLIPFVLTLAITIADVSSQSLPVAGLIPEFSVAVARNIIGFIVSGAVVVIGLAIANLFSNGFTTDVYLQLKGKKTEAIKALAVAPKTKKIAKRKPAKTKSRRNK